MNTLYTLLLASLLSFLRVQSLTAQVRTTTVAAQKGYPTFILGLHNKVDNFLKKEEIRMKLHIEELRRKSLDYRADELTEQYKELYLDLEDDFAHAFEQISRTFLSSASELDREQASEQEKAALIKMTKQEAQETIDNLLQKKEALLKNNF